MTNITSIVTGISLIDCTFLSTDTIDPKLPSSTNIVDGVGMVLFAVYHGIIIIVLVNMLIAMMSHSFESIQEDCDVEWKFARTQLWINYIDNGSTLPVPFNILPTPHSIVNAFRFIRNILRDETGYYGANIRSTAFVKFRRDKVVKEKDLVIQETTHSDIMQRLVRRYLFKMERENDAEAEKCKEPVCLRADDVLAAPVDRLTPFYGEHQQTVQFADAEEPPPLTPSARGLAAADHAISGTPVGLGGSGTIGTQQSSKRPRRLNYSASRRFSSNLGSQLLHSGTLQGLSLQLPQLDGIQRTQKILDMRLQNLQAQSDQLNCASGNAKIKEEIVHVRQLIGETQKALSSIVKAVSQMQEQIAMLNGNMEQWILAQASGREIRSVFVEQRTPSAKSRRKERRDLERSREREWDSLVREA
ncbi:hypothetical protein PHET_01149 [Paragonimus heterotremus]|uniref:Ion transport domain-containing protein n=1 Tax=Paragonimus heterotremus TaxID=100268 RepID=A0A8J4WL43_9TREM|nr:hypothetical protein PHET_01149 [Paragonimus heterotremus]